MKNQVLKSIAILGLFVLAVASVHAQTPTRIEVEIPFAFLAGKASLKAGAYSVKRISNSALAIRSADGETTALVNAPLTISSRDSKPGERLVFNRYGDRYFLSQVWLRSDTGRQLFMSDAETKAAGKFRLANLDAKPERVEISFHTR
jgi:hypothetical protein